MSTYKASPGKNNNSLIITRTRSTPSTPTSKLSNGVHKTPNTSNMSKSNIDSALNKNKIPIRLKHEDISLYLNDDSDQYSDSDDLSTSDLENEDNSKSHSKDRKAKAFAKNITFNENINLSDKKVENTIIVNSVKKRKSLGTVLVSDIPKKRTRLTTEEGNSFSPVKAEDHNLKYNIESSQMHVNGKQGSISPVHKLAANGIGVNLPSKQNHHYNHEQSDCKLDVRRSKGLNSHKINRLAENLSDIEEVHDKVYRVNGDSPARSSHRNRINKYDSNEWDLPITGGRLHSARSRVSGNGDKHENGSPTAKLNRVRTRRTSASEDQDIDVSHSVRTRDEDSCEDLCIPLDKSKHHKRSKEAPVTGSKVHNKVCRDTANGDSSSVESGSPARTSHRNRINKYDSSEWDLPLARGLHSARSKVSGNGDKWESHITSPDTRTSRNRNKHENIFPTENSNKTRTRHSRVDVDEDIPVSHSVRKRNGDSCDNSNWSSDVVSSPSDKLKRHKTPKGTPTAVRLKSSKVSSRDHTPSKSALKGSPQTPLQEAMKRLHVSAVPQFLPCREDKFQDICRFVEGKILDSLGGCMYISGVPGTGKTATVHAVIRKLKMAVKQGDLADFQFAEVNAMRLTHPREAYVHIFHELEGKSQRLTWQQARDALERRFTQPKKQRTTTVLLVDELDALWTRRQDVVYNLLDWPTKSRSRLVVITIANTMDLLERLMKGRICSRLGLTRVTFHPYTYQQLEKIILARLEGIRDFDPDAIQFVARKVASVSGDARRALDICRRATEIAEIKAKGCDAKVAMEHVDDALFEMMSSPKVEVISSCSQMEHLFLRAMAGEVERTGVEETFFARVYEMFSTICTFEGVEILSKSCAMKICNSLASLRLLLTEHSRADGLQRIILNISSDDLHFALMRIRQAS